MPSFAMVPSSSHLWLPRKPPKLVLPVRASSSSSSPVSSTSFDLKSYWTSLMSQINLKLDEAIPVNFPPQIYQAMRYSVLAKGAKRSAPVMCIATCELFGAHRSAAFPTACALEMVHAASLIHDDLPCMDDSTSRRGQPSNHTVYGVDMAILAGDALFPLGFHHIVSHTPSDLVPEAQLLRVISEIARSVGSTGMAAGQFLDLEGGPSEIGFIQEKKYGEMGECSAACGGLLAGAEDDDIERLRKYGRAVGVLYAIVNDILRTKTKSEKEGERKNRGKSYVEIYGIDKATELAEELKAKAKAELDGFPQKYQERVFPLYGFVDYAVDRSFSVVDATSA
ncbi:heterodimeric geranylgeranyl pyrophosphate synthase small subunit, chloroplastic-like [Prosopis cineraria]|uniref:heterodimeric geranylgeranyl pyrophosphate synthase small subunit, chloroplastic-like n=1 Tax=Prosopis cineraria TaxID=364024 RepID=UPI0024106106|nr:heterodimeric geranylgeranyl pyrophosphate synthase small subunit, chloroplastic-like [Prosopis cineraria]